MSDSWPTKRMYEALGFLNSAVKQLKNPQKVKLKFVGNLISRLAINFKWKVKAEFTGFINNRNEFLKKLSEAHIGINFAFKLGGTNVRKYDYALAGLVVLSNPYGCRGEPLPYEYCFLDPADLATKISALKNEKVEEMGLKNQENVLELYRRSYKNLKEKLKNYEIAVKIEGPSAKRISDMIEILIKNEKNIKRI